MSDKPWQFQPGQSGNRSGMPKSVGAALRAGRAEFLQSFSIFNNLLMRYGRGEIELERGQLYVIEKLYDRYLGKGSDTADLLLQDSGEDETALPNMRHADMQKLKNNMAMNLMYDWFHDGRLQHAVKLIEGGWKPNGSDEPVIVKDVVSKGQLVIEGKK